MASLNGLWRLASKPIHPLPAARIAWGAETASARSLRGCWSGCPVHRACLHVGDAAFAAPTGPAAAPAPRARQSALASATNRNTATGSGRSPGRRRRPLFSSFPALPGASDSPPQAPARAPQPMPPCALRRAGTGAGPPGLTRGGALSASGCVHPQRGTTSEPVLRFLRNCASDGSAFRAER